MMYALTLDVDMIGIGCDGSSSCSRGKRYCPNLRKTAQRNIGLPCSSSLSIFETCLAKKNSLNNVLMIDRLSFQHSLEASLRLSITNACGTLWAPVSRRRYEVRAIFGEICKGHHDMVRTRQDNSGEHEADMLY
jgi:hypothetical protein